MKNLKKQSLLALGGLAILMNAGAALSSTTHASATIDWSTFTITGYSPSPGTAPTYVLSGQSSNATSSISDWVNWNSNVSNAGSSFAARTEGSGIGKGSAAAERNANLTITGNGFLAISARYTLNAAINGIGCADSECFGHDSAKASVAFILENFSANAERSFSEANIGLGNSLGWSYSGLTSDQREGTLFVSVLVNNGDILNFSSFVSAEARQVTETASDPLSAVPVPAAMWLFGSALLGVVGFNRRRQIVTA